MNSSVVESEKSVGVYWELVIATTVAAATDSVVLDEGDCPVSPTEAYAFGAISGG